MSKILEFFSWLADALVSFFESILNFILYIIDFLSDIFDIVTDFVLEKLASVYSWISDIYNSFMLELTDAIPDLSSYWETSLGFLKPYLYVADEWVNISLFFDLFIAYVIFLTVFISVKMVLKLIPTIG